MPSANETLISSTQIKVVTPNDTTDCIPHKAIWIGGAGNLVVTCADGSDYTITGVLGGSLLPLQAKRIKTTSTCTNMMLWI